MKVMHALGLNLRTGEGAGQTAREICRVRAESALSSRSRKRVSGRRDCAAHGRHDLDLAL